MQTSIINASCSLATGVLQKRRDLLMICFLFAGSLLTVDYIEGNVQQYFGPYLFEAKIRERVDKRQEGVNDLTDIGNCQPFCGLDVIEAILEDDDEKIIYFKSKCYER